MGLRNLGVCLVGQGRRLQVRREEEEGGSPFTYVYVYAHFHLAAMGELICRSKMCTVVWAGQQRTYVRMYVEVGLAVGWK